jgi:selenocysteine lyase/cysteine desulfurase
VDAASILSELIRRPADYTRIIPDITALQHDPEYLATASLDALRRSDYPTLDAQDQVYLDYTGAGLFAQSQVAAHVEMLQRHISMALTTTRRSSP